MRHKPRHRKLTALGRVVSPRSQAVTHAKLLQETSASVLEAV